MKIYAYILLAGIMAYSYYWTFEQGKTVQAGVEAQARQDIKKDETEKVKIVYKEKIKVEVKYRDKVKEIYTAKDPTGCLDTGLGAAGLYNVPAGPGN